MLILSRGVTRESIGRVFCDIDNIRKTVTLKTKDGSAVAPAEVSMLQKYLRYHHPEIINKAGILTGWAITGELEVPL